MAEQEIEEYESDPEEAKLSLKMRRREASDEEEEEEEEEASVGVRDKPSLSLSRRIGDDSEDGESEGAVAEYEEDELDYDSDEDEYVEKDEEGIGGVEVVAVERAVKDGGGGGGGELEEESKGVSDGQSEVTDQISRSNVEDGRHEDKEEKKVVEPYAVPTAGAFYMHDDRFRDNAGGRHRRMLGGTKLWESKDDMKWGHDKFEELRTQDRNYEEHGRGSRGRHRGRGRTRGTERGYARDNRRSESASGSKQNNNNPNHASKGVRGRGPRRYQASSKSNNEAPLAQNKQSGKSMEKPSSVSSEKTSESVSNAKSDAVVRRKEVFASNLNIASPPFYPSNSSTNENNVMDKKNVHCGPISRNGQQSSGGENFLTAKSTRMSRGKNTVDSIGVDKLYIDDSQSTMVAKHANPTQTPFSGSSSVNSARQFRAQGRGTTSFSQMAYQPAVSNSQVNSQLQSVQGNAGKGHGQPSLQASSQQFSRRFSSGPQASSPPKATSAVNTNEPGDVESPSEPSHLKNALVAQDNGRGTVPFLYGGPQVMGASGSMGSGRGNQNFPAFLPVMQFEGQHPGGMRVPAVGMAFPGYVGQPQLGQGNSEMTWLPVIAGAGGALGATFCPPYLSVDGSYHARPSGQTPSGTAPSSKEDNATNDAKPAQKAELSNDDFGKSKRILADIRK